MSRELNAVVAGNVVPGWVMICNACWTTHSEPRLTQGELGLAGFRDAGWFIGRQLDLCPGCVATGGGIAKVATSTEPLTSVMCPDGNPGLLHSPDLWKASR